MKLHQAFKWWPRLGVWEACAQYAVSAENAAEVASAPLKTGERVIIAIIEVPDVVDAVQFVKAKAEETGIREYNDRVVSGRAG